MSPSVRFSSLFLSIATALLLFAELTDQFIQPTQQTESNQFNSYATPVAALSLFDIPRWPALYAHVCKPRRVTNNWPSSGKSSSATSLQLASACRASNADRQKHFIPIDPDLKIRRPSVQELFWLAQRIRLTQPQTDISQLENVHVVVNAANSQLKRGSGVCGALFRADGTQEMTAACRRVIRNKAERRGVSASDREAQIQTSQTAVTKANNLAAKGVNYVFHSVGPKLDPRRQGKPTRAQAAQLRATYWEALDKALVRQQKSIAFPCISTKAFHYDSQYAAHTALAAVRDWLLSDLMRSRQLQSIVFVMYSEEDYSLYLRNLPLYFKVPLSQLQSTPRPVQNANTKQVVATPVDEPVHKVSVASPSFDKPQRRSLTIFSDEYVMVSALDPLAPLPFLRLDSSDPSFYRSWPFTVALPGNRINLSHSPLDKQSLIWLQLLLSAAHSIVYYVEETFRLKGVAFARTCEARYYWHKMRLTLESDPNSGIAVLTVYGAKGPIAPTPPAGLDVFTPFQLMNLAKGREFDLLDPDPKSNSHLNAWMTDALPRDYYTPGLQEALERYQKMWEYKPRDPAIKTQ